MAVPGVWVPQCCGGFRVQNVQDDAGRRSLVSSGVPFSLVSSWFPFSASWLFIRGRGARTHTGTGEAEEEKEETKKGAVTANGYGNADRAGLSAPAVELAGEAQLTI